jgi:hypothetical protein
MIPCTSMRWERRLRGMLLVLGLVGLTAAGQATAACTDGGKAAPKLPDIARMVEAVYHPGQASGSLMPVTEEYNEEGASIVGLWEFKLAGFATDWGTQAWHSDGTELMFSGGQNPETGDVCQGVWRKIGPLTYTLNHIAMGYFSPGGTFGDRVHFHMVVRLDPSGKTFSGRYTVKIYAVTPAEPFDESVQVAGGTGTVTASRVKPD